MTAALSSATAVSAEGGALAEEAMATVGEAMATAANKAMSTMRNFIFDFRLAGFFRSKFLLMNDLRVKKENDEYGPNDYSREGAYQTGRCIWISKPGS